MLALMARAELSRRRGSEGIGEADEPPQSGGEPNDGEGEVGAWEVRAARRAATPQWGGGAERRRSLDVGSIKKSVEERNFHRQVAQTRKKAKKL